MIRRLVLPVTFCLLSCGDDADTSYRSSEIARIRAHLELVESELHARSDLQLTPGQQKSRDIVLAYLNDYIAAEKYPINDVVGRMTPIFIDRFGNRCAMAALIERSGHAEFVQRTAENHNLAFIEDLSGNPELKQWLDSYGLTLKEAARIQPSYAAAPGLMDWKHIDWTASVIGEGLVASDLSTAIGARVGIRAVATNMDYACWDCVYRSSMLMLEGLRTFARNSGATYQIAVLLQHTLAAGWAGRDELYVVGGPQITVDENGDHKLGVGGKAGLGFSRTWFRASLFAELTTLARNRPRGARAMVGLSLGLRF